MKIIKRSINGNFRKLPRKKENEDYMITDTSKNIFIVSDGMGGHPNGAFASWFASETIYKLMQKNILSQIKSSKSISEDRITTKLSQILTDTSAMAYSIGIQISEYYNMGTTTTASIIIKDNIYIGHVGDSSAYLFRNNILEKLTIDDLALKDKYGTNECIINSRTAGLEQFIGRENIEPQIISKKLLEKDILILATDGITKYVTDEELSSILKNKSLNESFNEIYHARKKMTGIANAHSTLENISLHESYKELRNEKGDNATMIMIKIENGDLNG